MKWNIRKIIRQGLPSGDIIICVNCWDPELNMGISIQLNTNRIYKFYSEDEDPWGLNGRGPVQNYEDSFTAAINGFINRRYYRSVPSIIGDILLRLEDIITQSVRTIMMKEHLPI